MFEDVFKWLNDNQGVLGLCFFLLPLLFYFISFIFKKLKFKSEFDIEINEGEPTFVCQVSTNEFNNNFEIYRTAISLHMQIVYLGFRSSSVKYINIYFRSKHLIFEDFKILEKNIYLEKLFHKLDFLYTFVKCEQTICIAHFQKKLYDNKIKAYPFLYQRNILPELENDLFFENVKSVNGIIYTESNIYSGNYEPKMFGNKVEIKVEIIDAFNKKHKKTVLLEKNELADAQKYFKDFGHVRNKFNSIN